MTPTHLLSLRRNREAPAENSRRSPVRGGKKDAVLVGFFLLLLAFPASSLSFVSAAASYSITINTSYNGVNNGISVSIMMDGASTGFNTPRTFSGLSGTHNFTMAYEDASGHPFSGWDITAPGDHDLSTLTVSSEGTYWAFYDTHVPRSNGGDIDSVSSAEKRYYVTPSDPTVVAAAAGKSWSDILNWVAAHITYNFSCSIWQFPNETLAAGTGQCREFSTLAVSMLLSRGYVAYIVSGNVTSASGIDTSVTNGHVWIAIQLNGTFYHFEPQRSWANQPTAANFVGYLAEYFNDNVDLISALASSDPPAAETYDVTIHTSYNGVFDGVHVAITQDDAATGFSTPHTFVGLRGSHNFTLPYMDGASHPFMCWGTNYPGDKTYTTINVTSGGSFSAFYDTGIVLSSLYPAEYMYLITPQDPAVEAAAAGKNYSTIVDLVSAVQYAYNSAPQFPNKTLTSGTHYFLDYASLCCSILRARGYTAYLVGGNSSGSTGGRWVVFSLNGEFYHVDPAYSWADQQTINFGTYQASYYVDENGIYPPGNSLNPPTALPNPTSNPTSTPTSSPKPMPTLTPTLTTTPTIIPNPTSIGSATATATPTTVQTTSPSPSVPELQAWMLLPALFAVALALIVFKRRKML